MPQCIRPELHKRLYVGASSGSQNIHLTVQTWPQVIFICFKVPLCGTNFRDDDGLKAGTEAWYGDQTYDLYFKSIERLNEKRTNYIEIMVGLY